MSKLKILAVTARFPPYHLGGYELRCKNILDGMAQRGHAILVLTSVKETSSKPLTQIPYYKIARKFHIRKRARHFLNELLSDLQDTAFLDRHIKHFQPDVIYLGHIMPLSKAIMPYLSGHQIPIVYDEGGMGLIDAWKNKGTWFYFVNEYKSRYSLLNRIKPFAADLVNKVSRNAIKLRWAWPGNMKVIFNSESNCRNTIARGVPVNYAVVIHSGVDTEKFSFAPRTGPGSPLVLLVPGRMEKRKGQVDAVELLAALRDRSVPAKLILVGEPYSQSYYAEVEKEVEKFDLKNNITFLPMLTQEKMVDLYHQADICFFPSYQKEGYSRIPLEALACGCLVISYGNESSGEIIRDKQNGFLVQPGDFQEMIAIVEGMMAEPGMYKTMANEARREIELNCSLGDYMNKVEQVIKDAVGMKYML